MSGLIANGPLDRRVRRLPAKTKEHNMKALAIQVWEMPALEFAGLMIVAAIFVAIVQYARTELHISRMKRMARQGLR